MESLRQHTRCSTNNDLRRRPTVELADLASVTVGLYVLPVPKFPVMNEKRFMLQTIQYVQGTEQIIQSDSRTKSDRFAIQSRIG